MDVVFYDRKHKCEVRVSQLMRTRVIATVIQGDDQDPPRSLDDFLKIGRWEGDEPGALHWHDIEIGNLGYKTPECPSYQNHDRWLLESDLVFLRLE